MRVVHTSRSPYEIWLLGFLATAGVTTLISPGATLTALPTWAVYEWAAGMTVACVAGLVAAFAQRLWALHVERGCVVWIAIGLVEYVAGALLRGNSMVTVGAVVLVGLAVASAFRAAQITRDIRRNTGGES